MPQPIALSDIKPNPLTGFATIDFDALVLDGFHVVLAFRTNHRISIRRRSKPWLAVYPAADSIQRLPTPRDRDPARYQHRQAISQMTASGLAAPSYRDRTHGSEAALQDRFGPMPAFANSGRSATNFSGI